MRKGLSLAILTAACAMAGDRPELTGTWQLDPAHSQMADSRVKALTWKIDQKEDSITIAEAVTEAGGKRKQTNIQCGTEGQVCKISEAGQPTQVTLYYNAAVLVMLEQWHGTDFATKKRIQCSADGKTLTVEVTHLAPPRKDETLTFIKQ